MNLTIKTSNIASFLNAKFVGSDRLIKSASSLNDMIEGSITFSTKKLLIQTTKINRTIICPEDSEYQDTPCYSIIKVKNPRLAFAKVVAKFFVTDNEKHSISPTTIVSNDCNIDTTVSIGNNCTIGKNVIIGVRTKIRHNVVIYDNTIIGTDCYIKSGSILGEDGFGFDFEEDRTPIRIPHLGNLIIGNNVEIGSNTVIARGTLVSTTIGDFVKIDDQVFIAHNCNIGRKTLITACTEISGSVTIGENCWIGPNCSIIHKVVIGDNTTIGLGAVITHNIESNKKIMGLEGLDLKSLLRLKQRINYSN